MAKDKITEYDATANNNTVVGDVNLAENSALPSDMNNAVREIMSHQKEAFGSGTPLYVDQTNNRVGIGTTPSAKLSLPAQASGDSGVARLAIESAVDSNDFTIAQYEDSTGTYTQIGQNVSLNSGGSTTVLDSGHRTASMFFDGRGNGALMFHTGGTNANAERMRIDSSGNVGIGTTSPVSGTKLTINDSAFGGLQFQSGGSDCGYIGVNTNTLFVGGGSAVAFHTGNAQATDGTERMRIDANGKIQMGGTTARGRLNATFNSNDTAEPTVFFSNDGSTGVFASFGNTSGTVVGTIRRSGSSTAYNTSSDYRLKENVDYTFDATTRLKQLKPARFNFIADTNTTVDGFLAHEVSSIVPEAISGEKDATNKDGSIKPQGIDQSKLVPLLVKTIQELEARITALEGA